MKCPTWIPGGKVSAFTLPSPVFHLMLVRHLGSQTVKQTMAFGACECSWLLYFFMISEEDSSEINLRLDGETDVLYLKTSPLGGATASISQGGSLLHEEGNLPCSNNLSIAQMETSPR